MNEQARNVGVMELITKNSNYWNKIYSQCHIFQHKSDIEWL
jgi:hypothetical protein